MRWVPWRGKTYETEVTKVVQEHVSLNFECFLGLVKIKWTHVFDIALKTARYHISSVQFSHSVMSDSFWPHGLQHARLPCPSPTPGDCSNSCPSFGEGNGNPLRYSCLQNPMDRGVWWAAVCGVTQSRTRLKRLSSSSSSRYYISNLGII